MPELPEVETIKQDLEKKIVGLTINNVLIYDDRIISGHPTTKFIRSLQGKTIQTIARRAKAIIITFRQNGYLVVHLKMTGQLIYGRNLKVTQNLKETKLVLALSNGDFLNYNDQRLFGRLIFVKDLREISYLNSVGPEPLNGNFTEEWLKENLSSRKAPIKTLLMNQSFLAGIGNIYASEILFNAHINPRKLSGRLTQEEIGRLCQSTRSILQEAIEQRGTSMRNYRDADGQKGGFISRIRVYAREDEPCYICRASISRIVQAGRSTFFCKKCQK